MPRVLIATAAGASGAVELAAGIALAAVAAALAVAAAPDASVIDVLACAKFYPGRGCLP